MSFLKKESVRISAAVLMAASVAVGLIISSSEKYDYISKYSALQEKQDEEVQKLDRYRHEAYDICNKLWLFDKMYLRNLDENGELTGSKYYKESIIKNLKKAEIMDENGSITLPESERINYAIGWDDVVYSNFDENFDFDNAEVNSDTYLHCRNRVMFPENNFYISFNGSWYSNKEGMEYYYDGDRGYAVYDYDTSKLDSYTDSLGAAIYINEDGTVPIPRDYNTDSGRISYDAEVLENDDSFDVPSYEKYDSNDFNAYMYICPTDEACHEYNDYIEKYDKIIAGSLNKKALSFMFMLLAAVLAVYLFIVSGYDNKTEKFKLGLIDKVWAEIYIVVICGSIIAIGEILSELNYYTDNLTMSKTAFVLPVVSALTAIYGVDFICANSIFKRLKCRSLINTTLSGKLIKSFFRLFKEGYKRIEESISNKEKYKNDVFIVRFTARTILFTVAGAMVCILSAVKMIEVLPFIVVAVIAAFYYFNMKDLIELSKLGEHVNKISSGNYSPVTVEKKSVIYAMTENLNNMAEGIEKVVEKQVSAERMKIDLVTNVSHDLKTPLTSIVSYVDLLSQEELSPAAQDYVKILEQKTERLRDIVADLFDIAKATSKNDIKLENIDAVVLTKQVLGDMEDKIQKSGRKLVTEIIPEKAPIVAEGKKLYRVLQNVIDNALKYSLDGTRVFLKLTENDGNICIELRNTASYEMKFTPEEITERFARGDKARTSEGSGLGLSIAKSFTEACGGEFNVNINGDVFEVFIRFSLLT